MTGVDQSPEFIAAAQRLAAEDGVGDRVEFVVGDAHELDLPAASFDAAVARTLVSTSATRWRCRASRARHPPGGSVAIFDGDYASLTFGSADRSSARRWRSRSGDDHELARVMRELPACCRRRGCG